MKYANICCIFKQISSTRINSMLSLQQGWELPGLLFFPKCSEEQPKYFLVFSVEREYLHSLESSTPNLLIPVPWNLLLRIHVVHILINAGAALWNQTPWEGLDSRPVWLETGIKLYVMCSRQLYKSRIHSSPCLVFPKCYISDDSESRKCLNRSRTVSQKSR